MYKFGCNTQQIKIEEDPDDLNDVDENSNEIFFYTSVNKKSILDLNKKIYNLRSEFQIIKSTYDYPEFNPHIKLHINSGGGNLLDCFAAVDLIRKEQFPVHTIVEGSAASAATLMSVVGKQRFITKHSYMLIHQLSSGVWGKFEEIKDEMHNCNILMDTINEIYTKYTKIPKNVLKETLKRDIYMDSKTCLKYGLVDKILE